MPVLTQFTYIFATGMVFAFLDAWNIGANDVANSFATSVSSRSLTLMQAMLIASVCEFAGGVLVGARVADTIRSKIISVKHFEAEPSVLMLGMLCALIGSSTWLTAATKMGLPVSTTHCIVGGVIGVGIATIGSDGVQWGWTGVAQVFAAWGIAPAISGAFAAIIFLLTQHTVLNRRDPLRAGLRTIPLYFFFTSAILTMVVVWKGAPSLNVDDWSTGQVLGCILGVGTGVALLSALLLVPYLHRKLVDEDWTLKWWEWVYGPLLYRRGPVPPIPDGFRVELVQDYYRGHATLADLEAAKLDPETIAAAERARAAKPVKSISSEDAEGKNESTDTDLEGEQRTTPKLAEVERGPWYTPSNILHFLRYKSGPIIANAFLHGVRQDVVSSQSRGKSKWGNVAKMHAHAAQFDNKTEHLYSFLQILTAATASFAHGANDLSNAVGPLSSIFLIYETGTTASKAPVPVWVLVYGATAIVVGLWTYGYNIMRNLGNRLTLMSPSRGFSMELGAATTVVLATRLALPVSTTQCIVGAVVGVGLCNGDFKAVNWRMVAWCYMGWFITLPVAATIAGCLMAFVIHAPQFGRAL